ncbi:MAG: DUF427 domain-containing protein [Henriciella sp.]|nr:DUF427 domain-containing protein [Henriciella sp.]
MRRQLTPGPDHPIAIELKTTPVSVTLAGVIIFEVSEYFELREASYPPVAYLPRHLMGMSLLERSTQTTWCPYKGEASYYHLRTLDGSIRENAIWTYETPFPAVAAIKDALAIYPNQVDAIKFG